MNRVPSASGVIITHKPRAPYIVSEKRLLAEISNTAKERIPNGKQPFQCTQSSKNIVVTDRTNTTTKKILLRSHQRECGLTCYFADNIYHRLSDTRYALPKNSFWKIKHAIVEGDTTFYYLILREDHNRTIEHFDSEKQRDAFIKTLKNQGMVDADAFCQEKVKKMDHLLRELHPINALLTNENACWPVYNIQIDEQCFCDVLFVMKQQITMVVLPIGTDIHEYIAQEGYINVKKQLEETKKYLFSDTVYHHLANTRYALPKNSFWEVTQAIIENNKPLYCLIVREDHNRIIERFDSEKQRDTFIETLKSRQIVHADTLRQENVNEMEKLLRDVYLIDSLLTDENACWPIYGIQIDEQCVCDVLFVMKQKQITMVVIPINSDIQEYIAQEGYTNVKKQLEETQKYPTKIQEIVSRLNLPDTIQQEKEVAIDRRLKTQFLIRCVLTKENACWPLANMLFVMKNKQIIMVAIPAGTDTDEYIAAQKYTNLKQELEKEGEYSADIGEIVSYLNHNEVKSQSSSRLLPGEVCSFASPPSPYTESFPRCTLQVTKGQNDELSYRYFIDETKRKEAREGFAFYSERSSEEKKRIKQALAVVRPDPSGKLFSATKDRQFAVFRYETHNLARIVAIAVNEQITSQTYLPLPEVDHYLKQLAEKDGALAIDICELYENHGLLFEKYLGANSQPGFLQAQQYKALDWTTNQGKFFGVIWKNATAPRNHRKYFASEELRDQFIETSLLQYQPVD